MNSFLIKKNATKNRFKIRKIQKNHMHVNGFSLSPLIKSFISASILRIPAFNIPAIRWMQNPAVL